MTDMISNIEQKLRETADEAARLEKQESELYARLGQDAFEFLRESSEFADKTREIAEIAKKRSSLTKTAIELEGQLEREKREEKKRVALRTCFSCGSVNPDGAAFCQECGDKVGVKPKSFCETCGTLNAPEQKYCGECGEKLPG